MAKSTQPAPVTVCNDLSDVDLVVNCANSEHNAEKDLAAFKACKPEFKRYRVLRAAYVKARMELGVSRDTADTQWRRFCKKAGYGKAPQSDSKSATAKRAARQTVAKTDKPTAASDSPKVGKQPIAPVKGKQPIAPIKGKETANAISVKLNAIEAHLIDLFRRGKFADIVDIVQSEAAKVHPA